MKLHMIAFAIALPLLSLVAAPPAASQVWMDIGVRFGPPAPVYEEVYAPPFAHAVWARGHWMWNIHAGRYVWARGHWMASRPAYKWMNGDWHRGPKGWYWNEGRWELDGNGLWNREYNRGHRKDEYSGKARGIGHGRERG